MKAYLNIVAICAAAAAAVSTPAWAAASCNEQHATCQQRGGTEERCLMIWHQCKVAVSRVRARAAPAGKLVSVSSRR